MTTRRLDEILCVSCEGISGGVACSARSPSLLHWSLVPARLHRVLPRGDIGEGGERVGSSRPSLLLPSPHPLRLSFLSSFSLNSFNTVTSNFSTKDYCIDFVSDPAIMHGLSFLSLSLILPALSTAHFQLLSPPARGFDEDKLATFPCGGQDTVSSNRTMFPLSGGPIQLNMEHDEAAVQVLLAMGNDPGSNFNITLLPIMQEQGIGKFCIAGDMVPMSAMAMDGMNATIQVVTNGDPNGGLYNVRSYSVSADTAACLP